MDNDGLVVIGAGLPRTGTLSTRAALERLVGPYRLSFFVNKCYPEDNLIVPLTRSDLATMGPPLWSSGRSTYHCGWKHSQVEELTKML